MARNRSNWSRGRGSSGKSKSKESSVAEQSTEAVSQGVEPSVQAAAERDSLAGSQSGSASSTAVSHTRTPSSMEAAIGIVNSHTSTYTEQSREVLPDGTVRTESYQEVSDGRTPSQVEAAIDIVNSHTSTYTEQSREVLPDGTVRTESYQEVSDGRTPSQVEAAIDIVNSHTSTYTEQSREVLPDGTVRTEIYQEVSDGRTETPYEASMSAAAAAEGAQAHGFAQELPMAQALEIMKEFRSTVEGTSSSNAEFGNSGTSSSGQDTSWGGSAGVGESAKESSLVEQHVDAVLGADSESQDMGTSVRTVEDFKALFPQLDQNFSLDDFAQSLSPETVHRLTTEGINAEFVSELVKGVDDTLVVAHTAEEAEMVTFGVINTAWGENGASYPETVGFAQSELDSLANMSNVAGFSNEDREVEGSEAEAEAEAEMSAE